MTIDTETCDTGRAAHVRDETGTTVTLRVEGMTCGSCEAHVRRALEAVPGVTGAVVSRQDGTATVRWGSSAPASAALVDAVVGAGYDAGIATIAQDAALVEAPVEAPVEAARGCGCGEGR